MLDSASNKTLHKTSINWNAANISKAILKIDKIEVVKITKYSRMEVINCSSTSYRYFSS